MVMRVPLSIIYLETLYHSIKYNLNITLDNVKHKVRCRPMPDIKKIKINYVFT